MTNPAPAPPKKAWFSISKNVVRTLGLALFTLGIDRAFTHESTAAIMVTLAAGLGAAVWGAVDWLEAHTALSQVIAFTDDDKPDSDA